MARKKILDPNQIEFLKNYLNPKSKTFGNVVQSAIKAKFSESYANNLTTLMPSWLSENIGEMDMVKKAERNLQEMLEMDITNKGITKDRKEIYEFDDTGKLRVKADITKFVAERLHKNKWSERKEITGDEGEPVQIDIGIKTAIKKIYG